MFITLNKETLLSDILAQSEYRNRYKAIIFTRPVQSGKTADILKVAETFYKDSAIIFVSDKNTALAEQTNSRAKVLGFQIHNYRDSEKLGKIIGSSVGKKKVVHLLMEINNLERLDLFLDLVENLPITLIIDEADKSRSTSEGMASEDEESTDSNTLPPITALLLKIKNKIKTRENSRTIFVTASPVALYTSEKENWLTIYKEPYQNYTGVGLNHPHNLFVIPRIQYNTCKVKTRWTETPADIQFNTFYEPLHYACEQFAKASSKDTSVKQLMLVSLENHNAPQFRMSEVIKKHFSELGADIDVRVFNSVTKDSADTTLADIIKSGKANKMVIVSGFMASRGVSFTDFSDPNNKYELILQVHHTKKQNPLNSSLQAMRVMGPARRTVSKAAIICNQICADDLNINFLEFYRVCKDLAENNLPVKLGSFNSLRPLTQEYNFRYLKQGHTQDALLYPSLNPDDHLPII